MNEVQADFDNLKDPMCIVSRAKLLPSSLINTRDFDDLQALNRQGDFKDKKQLNNLLLFALILLAAVLGSSFVNKLSDLVSKLNITVASDKINTQEPTASDIEIMKKILAGLVPAVDTMRQEIDALKSKSSSTDLDAPYSYNKPVKVISEKAYIRESPGKDTKSLMTIAKDTILFAEIREGDWLKVALPIGGKGYIHSSTVIDESIPETNKG